MLLKLTPVVLLCLILRAAYSPLTSVLAQPEDPCVPTKWWHCPESGHTGHCASGAKAYRYHCRQSVDYDACSKATACSTVVEQKDCSSIYADGLCRPWWTEWSAFSKCLDTPGACGLQQRSQRRHCAGLSSHANPAAERGSCRDRRVLVKMRRQGKSVTVRASSCPVKLHCPKINGGWSEWGAPSVCSVSCGIGHQEIKRHCDNPSPSGGGMPCSGFDAKRVICLQAQPCPLDGAWCAWSHVEKCDASCGTGVGIRMRECKCPKQLNGGAQCVGPETELSNCNLEHCPYSEQLFEDERRFLRDSLRATSQEQAFARMGQSAPVIGGELYLQCGVDLPIRKQLFDRPGRFPERRFYWTKDNKLLEPSERIQFDSEFLHVLSVIGTDAGLYQLMVVRTPGREANTVCFFPVPVLDTVVRVPEDSHFNLTCPLAPLTNVTPTMMGAWRIHWSFAPSPLGHHFGGKPVRQLWVTNSVRQSLEQAGVAHISSMAAHMEGTYQCYAQLMFVKDLNATDPYADPPPPEDDSEDPYKIATTKPRVLVITDIELSELFLTARITLQLVPNPSINQFMETFASENFAAIFALIGCACFLALFTCVLDCVRALLSWRRRIWLQHLDAEEMNLIRIRMREVQTGWTRQHDRDLKKNS